MFGFLGAAARIFAIIVEVLSPLFKAVVEGLVWFGKALWEGFKDVIDSFYTILFVLTVVALGIVYGTVTVDRRTPDAVDRPTTKFINKITGYKSKKTNTQTKQPTKKDWSINWERFGN